MRHILSLVREWPGTAITMLLPVLTALVALPSCSTAGSGTAQKITIGSTHNEADTLIYVARGRGFFAANSLDVAIKDYTSGSAAVEGMLKGEVDLATSSEFVIVQHALRRQGVVTVALTSKNYSTQLVGRTDRGIRNVADLEGKKIGVPGQTLAQFQFSRFLDLNGASGKPMTVVNIDITQSINVLVSGDVDAVQTWEPYVSALRDKLGDALVVWCAHSGLPQFKNLTVTSAWLQQGQDLTERVSRSLATADDYIARYPGQAMAIIRNYLQYDDEYVAAVWPLNQFTLSLDQSLIAAMEDEARWLIKNNLTTERQVPDFTSHIYVAGLKAVKPEAVNLIR